MMLFPVIIFLWAFGLGYSVNMFHITGIEKLKKVPMKEFTTESGIKLLIPTLSDQCWDSALPSTPEPEKGLALIGSTIDEGFCIK